MNKAKLILLGAIVSICLGGLLLFVFSGQVIYDPQSIVDSLPLNVDMQISGINFTEVTEGRKEWTLKADTMHYLKAENLMVFNQVKATFYAEDGPMQITGNQGYYDRAAKRVRLTGSVRAQDSQGNKLATEEIKYDIQTRVVTAPGLFKLTGPKVNLSGRGLSINTKENRIMVVGRPTLVIKSTDNLL